MKTSNIIAIGDIHGSTYWKKIVKSHPNSKYIFLGDYLDPSGDDFNFNEIIGNLMEIIQLKKEQPDNVILLFGNHDLQYVTSAFERGTGYDWMLAGRYKRIFLDHFGLFQNACQIDDYIFTHAGISHKWFVDDFKGDIHANIADQLNNPKPEQLKALYRCGEVRGGDKGDTGGIFWADMSELENPLQGYTQIVGHNSVEHIEDYSNNGGRVIFCDCLDNRHYLQFGLYFGL